jgi:hypothetical protein
MIVQRRYQYMLPMLAMLVLFYHPLPQYIVLVVYRLQDRAPLPLALILTTMIEQ